MNPEPPLELTGLFLLLHSCAREIRILVGRALEWDESRFLELLALRELNRTEYAMGVNELGRAIGCSRQRISPLVRGLEERELVEFGVDRWTPRRKPMWITEKGREELRYVAEVVESVMRPIVTPGVDQMAVVLERMWRHARGRRRAIHAGGGWL